MIAIEPVLAAPRNVPDSGLGTVRGIDREAVFGRFV
jgi:hypothetical protein